MVDRGYFLSRRLRSIIYSIYTLRILNLDDRRLLPEALACQARSHRAEGKESTAPYRRVSLYLLINFRLRCGTTPVPGPYVEKYERVLPTLTSSIDTLMPRRRRPPRAGALTDLPPLKILRQIVLLQSAYYICATILILFTTLVAGKVFTFDLILSWRSIRGDTTVGWTLGLCWMLNSVLGYAPCQSNLNNSLLFSALLKPCY